MESYGTIHYPSRSMIPPPVHVLASWLQQATQDFRVSQDQHSNYFFPDFPFHDFGSQEAAI